MNWKKKIVEKLKESTLHNQSLGTPHYENAHNKNLVHFFKEIRQILTLDINDISKEAKINIKVEIDEERFRVKWTFLERYLLLRFDKKSEKIIISVSTEQNFDQIEIYKENNKVVSFYDNNMSDVDFSVISKKCISLFFE